MFHLHHSKFRLRHLRQLLNHHQFIHGLDFYGSFNGIKNDFYYNVIDDIDYLDKNPFFIKNKDMLFTIEDEDYDYGENSSECDSDNDDHISLDSMGKVKPKNNTRNRRAKIKIVNSNSGGNGGIPKGYCIVITSITFQ